MPLIVDNTVATPILLQPIDYGADIVVHSLTKFMGGHGTTLGGTIVDSGQLSLEGARRSAFRCSTSRTPPTTAWSTPSISARAAYIARCRSVYQRTTGAVLSPLSAFLLLQGIETVALRVERHVENAGASPNFCAAIRASSGSTMPAFRTAPITRWRRNISAAAPARC